MISPNLFANLTANLMASLTAQLTGNLVTNLTDGLTAHLTGNLAANLTANLTASLTAHLTGNLAANLTANLTSSLTAHLTGNLVTNLTDGLTGNLTANLTVLWIALPFFAGFSAYLLPRFSRFFSLFVALVSLGYGLEQILAESPFTLQLLDRFGVALAVDSLSGFFVLTNAIVTAAVVLYCWQEGKSPFFYTQILILHGSVNSVFICADFMSLYVALEVISIASFLLMVYPRTTRSIWVGLRYLFVSNVAMLFYLVGVVLVYQTHQSFAFQGLQGAPPEALALIFLGLLTKGGIFVSGLWLPLTHSEAETPVSALLSGVVVKTGVFPLVRCALTWDAIDPIVRIFGVGTALLGVGYAVFEKDTKRMLAFHTVSQLGFVLAAPEVGGFYALTHGLVKSALFLIAGNLPSRNLKELRHQPIDLPLWSALVIAGFSISGFPLLSGFGAKVLTMKNLLPWQVVGMNVAALGTAISFAKFIFLPPRKPQGLFSQANAPARDPDRPQGTGSETGSETRSETRSETGSETVQVNVQAIDRLAPPQSVYPTPLLRGNYPIDPHQSGQSSQSSQAKEKGSNPGFWAALVLLIGGLFVANVVYYEAYTIDNVVKPLATIALGWLAYGLIFRNITLKLPQGAEQFEHLIGVMSLMVILLFWMVLA